MTVPHFLPTAIQNHATARGKHQLTRTLQFNSALIQPVSSSPTTKIPLHIENQIHVPKHTFSACFAIPKMNYPLNIFRISPFASHQHS